MGADQVASDVADERLSPMNLMKNLWKLLNSSYSHVVQWIISLSPNLDFEITKYQIQMCGCIEYYFELLDGKWNFGFR